MSMLGELEDEFDVEIDQTKAVDIRTVQEAADYLETDLYDFYLRIQAFDYRVEKLPEEKRQHLMDSLLEIERLLRNAYGSHADYEIYLGEGYRAEFTAGGSANER